MPRVFDSRVRFSAKMDFHTTAALCERVEAVAAEEDTSRNGALNTLVTTGVDFWEWVQENDGVINKLKKTYNLSYRELLTALCEVGLEIFRKDPKTWKAFAFGRKQVPPGPQ